MSWSVIAPTLSLLRFFLPSLFFPKYKENHHSEHIIILFCQNNGWTCCSVVQHLPSIYKVLGSRKQKCILESPNKLLRVGIGKQVHCSHLGEFLNGDCHRKRNLEVEALINYNEPSILTDFRRKLWNYSLYWLVP